MEKSRSRVIIIITLLIIYIYKINEIAVEYRIHIKEEREKEERREKEFEKLKEDFIKQYSDGKNEIIYNKCVNEKIPKVTGMLETAQFLYFTNSSFIRFGDSEINILRQKNDFKQDFNQTLYEKLYEAFFNDYSNVMIGVPNVLDGFPRIKRGAVHYWLVTYKGLKWLYRNLNYSKQYFDNLITSSFTSTLGTSCELVNLTYYYLKEVFRDKDLIILRGNNSEVYDYDVYEYAKSQKIFYAPPKNAWEKYDEIKETLMKEDPKALFVIAIGISSEVLVMDLVKDGRRAMDMGHLAKDYDCFMKQKYDREFFS